MQKIIWRRRARAGLGGADRRQTQWCRSAGTTEPEQLSARYRHHV